ncbi:hypothetical protein ACFYUD_03710 [Nocardia tengchongensis]|uniref:hypothetical protein n=1 Tax=Nocardia tengchongensis TaxID=2055889 RepID=UPI0036CC9CC2
MELEKVVGANCRALRGTASMEDLADHARRFGVRWNSGSIAKIEQGAHRTTLTSIVVLAAALESLHEFSVGVPDLLKADGPIELTDVTAVENGAMLIEILSGGANLGSAWPEVLDRRVRESLAVLPGKLAEQFDRWPAGIRMTDAAKLCATFDDADSRIGRSLGMSPDLLAAWCLRVWGKSFVAERDSRAGKNANAQKRGRVTREMKAELEQVIRDAT